MKELQRIGLFSLIFLGGCASVPRETTLSPGECVDVKYNGGEYRVCNAMPVRGYWQDHKLPPVLDSSIPSAEVP